MVGMLSLDPEGVTPGYDPAGLVRTFAGYPDPRLLEHRDLKALPAYLRLTSFRVHTDMLLSHVRPESRVLEIGPGVGTYTRVLAGNRCQVVVADISDKQLGRHAEWMRECGAEPAVLSRQHCDIVELPFDSRSFDAVVCYGGPISYVRDRGADAVREMLRVVRPGGAVLASVMPQGWVDRRARSLLRDGRIGLEQAQRLHESGDHAGDGLPAGSHEFRAYTWAKLRQLVEGEGAEVLDGAGSWDGKLRGSWDRYLRRCRGDEVRNGTGGYLAIAARRPGGDQEPLLPSTSLAEIDGLLLTGERGPAAFPSRGLRLRRVRVSGR